MASQVFCAYHDTARSACYGEPTHKHQGAHYCLFHWPSEKKKREFDVALKLRRASGNYDFRGVWFPEPLHFIESPDPETSDDFETTADFSHATFNGGIYCVGVTFKEGATFQQAVFKVGAMFQECAFIWTPDFRGATFEVDANFTRAHFRAGADFSSATFVGKAMFAEAHFYKNHEAKFKAATFEREAHFEFAKFKANANFQNAHFHGEARFIKTTFAVRASFIKATFRDYVRFEGTEEHKMFNKTTMAPEALPAPPRLELQSAKIENPRRVFFDSLSLRPHWFVKVENARDLNFRNVKWAWGGAREEIEGAEDSEVPAPRESLEITCRQLADNADDNHLYEDASRFRFLAMEAQRLEKWRGFVPWKLSWWYWLASGYGESALKAAGWLAFIWLASAVFYFSMDFPHWQKASAESSAAATKRVGAWEATAQALVYSAGVMTLQRPEPRPTDTAAQGLVMLETILGPIQGALLALAIRRKFMR